MTGFHPRSLDPADGAVGDSPKIQPDGTVNWGPDTSSSGVESIVPGAGIDVDATDPANPVVSATGSPTGGAGELLMQDGVTGPPVPLETEAGDDWLYQG